MATETTEHAVGMPQLDFSTFPNQIFWLVLTLVVLYFILNRVALPRISGILHDRQRIIQADLNRAEEIRLQVTEAEAAYNQALKEARSQAAQIIAETKAEIQKELDKALVIADTEIAAKVKESEKTIQAIRKNAQESVSEVAAAVAHNLVETLMPALADAKKIKTHVATRLEQ